MKAIKETTLDILEQTALAGAKAITAYLEYKGENVVFFAKARIGAAAISAYARTRASESNRQAVELMSQRMIGGQLTETVPVPKQLRKA
jgi:ribosomal protein S2